MFLSGLMELTEAQMEGSAVSSKPLVFIDIIRSAIE
jgi:hypothetical protein